jgi:hypothetical protein
MGGRLLEGPTMVGRTSDWKEVASDACAGKSQCWIVRFAAKTDAHHIAFAG